MRSGLENRWLKKQERDAIWEKWNGKGDSACHKIEFQLFTCVRRPQTQYTDTATRIKKKKKKHNIEIREFGFLLCIGSRLTSHEYLRGVFDIKLVERSAQKENIKSLIFSNIWLFNGVWDVK